LVEATANECSQTDETASQSDQDTGLGNGCGSQDMRQGKRIRNQHQYKQDDRDKGAHGYYSFRLYEPQTAFQSLGIQNSLTMWPFRLT